MQNRVVITGCGVVNPSGIGNEQFWNNIALGKNSISHIAEFAKADMPTQVAGKLSDFNEKDYIPRRYAAKIDTFTKYAWAAANLAIEDAQLDFAKEDRNRVGVWLGNNAGGWDICERGLYEMYRDGPQYVNPWQATAWFLSSPQGYLTIANNLHGMSKSFACDRASAASALYFAYRNIRSGINDIILAGGTEAPITPFAMNCYYDIGEMATTTHDTTSYKPFDKNSTGLLIGEGSTILILEELEHAKKRGARIYGEILGAASFTDVDTSANKYFCKTIATALKNADIAAENIDVVFGEGAGKLELDIVEAETLHKVFANNINNLLATFPKSGYGHLYGASTATDFACALLSGKNKAIVPTPNHETVDDNVKFKIPTKLIHKELKHILINSRAREGTNFSFVVKT
jgi:3-oxoacyl-[acyl-carrier-protein] synthase II